MSDNISRADAIEAIQNAYCKPCKERGDDHNEVRCRVCEYDNAIIQIDALPSAEPKRVLLGYCKGANCKWWNPQVEGCNRCVFVKDEYYHTSADIPYMFSEAYVNQLRFERDYLQAVVNDQWIPCSERLPKEKQEVYVTAYFIEGDTGRAYGYMDGFGKWHLYSTVEGILNSGYEVTAWMPLPTSYKGGDDE